MKKAIITALNYFLFFVVGLLVLQIILVVLEKYFKVENVFIVTQSISSLVVVGAFVYFARKVIVRYSNK